MKLTSTLSAQEFYNIIFGAEELNIDAAVMARAQESYDFLKHFAEDKVIYGVNTGFGPMAQYRIENEHREQLQYNLIRSHCTGTGTPFSEAAAKATMLARLNTLSLGKSGIHPSVIALLADLINKNITPLIFEHGGVGASGDLVQLAHLALVLIGEGEVFYKGARRSTAEVFAELNIDPIKVHIREGLGLMNGTSAMTGLGFINIYYAKKLVALSTAVSCLINEMVQAYSDHFSEELNATKLHTGQQKIAETMRRHTRGSALIRKREDHLYQSGITDDVFRDKVQEYYSLRCVPQILGPVYDTVQYAEKVLENELNSANDNPIILPEHDHVYHGGNFHGDYISLEMDKVKIVITKLTMLAERQLNYLLNSKINEILPPFVNLGKLGLNFGMQGAQFTATSTTAESQMLSNPMYIHSIPNNNDNQDVVSMGTNAATICSKVIDNAFQVLSIQIMTAVQAIDFLKIQDQLSPASAQMYSEIRALVPAFAEDIVLYPYIQKVTQQLKTSGTICKTIPS